MRLVDQRRFQHLPLPDLVEILVDDMPINPRIAADMAERQVRRQLVEPIGCRLGQQLADHSSASRRSSPAGS